MKKCIAVILVLCMVCVLIACGISKDVQAAEDAINAIGEVTLESEPLIKTAEKLYGILTDSEKSSVSNRLALVEAREEFDKLQAEEQAKQEEQRKQKDVQAAEDAINAIGEVTLESESLIKTAEKLYGILTDSEKSSVSNRLALVEAREEFDKLQAEEQVKQEEQRKQKVYENAKSAYEKLNEAAQLCIDGMDDIYGAWHWGIYKAKNAYSGLVFYDLASATPHFTSAELEATGYSETLVKGDWNYAVFAVEKALTTRGDYDTVKTKMSEAQSILHELTTTYDDYTYYPKLKDYYAAVDSYVTFFLSPTGSFSQLADTVNNYETNIRTYQSDVGFLFNE